MSGYLKVSCSLAKLCRKCVIVVAAIFLTGCGTAPVQVGGNANDAVQAVKDVLKEWQAGKTVAELKGASPSIVVRDEEWEAGVKLTAFEVQPEAKAEGGNWKVDVTITTNGAIPGPKAAAYSVTVEPRILVFRMDNVH